MEFLSYPYTIKLLFKTNHDSIATASSHNCCNNECCSNARTIQNNNYYYNKQAANDKIYSVEYIYNNSSKDNKFNE